MLSTKKMEELIGMILTAGILLSIGLVIVGGTLYLLHHGHDLLAINTMPFNLYQTNVMHILTSALSFSPLGIIDLGLVILVATQLLRVALLVWFYFSIHDYWFMSVSLFILSILLYSFILRSAF